MSAHRIDGKALADALRREVAAGAGAYRERTGSAPRLDIVLVGDDAASASYVAGKTRAAAESGIEARLHRPPAEGGEAAILDLVRSLDAAPEVNGILVQLPLPEGVRNEAVLEAISPEKDVDGFHPLNAGRLATGLPGALLPCTPRACLRLLDAAGRTLGLGTPGEGPASDPTAAVREAFGGKRAVVLGRSNIVGKPVALLLLGADCTVTVAHSRTAGVRELCREAEILVAAVGRPEFVRGDWIREGAVVIDVGINRVAGAEGKGRLVGDVATAEALPRAAAITPVPGGVGPMTVACLLENTLLAAERQLG